MNKIVAIVVTYNRKELLLSCIDHILSQNSIAPDILVIDNASTDGTQDKLQEYIADKKIKYFNTGSNIGGAGGFNYGLKKAYVMGYEYFWLMDDDTFPDQDALTELLKADKALSGKFGYLSSVAYWKDGSLCNMNIQRTTIKDKVRNFDEPYIPIAMATFVSFFMTRSVLEKYGLPIKDFFIWSDDMEYSRRISMEMPCYLVTRSKVVHFMMSNAKVGIEHDSTERLWRYKYLYRNEVYVYRREGIKGWVYMLLRIILHSLRILKSSNKGMKLKVVWTSFFKGFVFHPAIESVKNE